MRFRQTTDRTGLWITLEGGHYNEFDLDTLMGLTQAIRQHHDKPIMISAVGKVFCAGLDLSQMLEHGSAKELIHGLVEMYDALVDHPCPIACLVTKQAIGGGVGLVLCADAVIMTCNASLSLPDNPLYRPLAEVLFPIVSSRRNVDPKDFDDWYRKPASAAELYTKGYVDRVVHPKDGKPLSIKRLKEEALSELGDQDLLDKTNLEQHRQRPNPDDVSRRIDHAIQASKRPAFRVSARITLGQIQQDPRAVFIVHGRDMFAVEVLKELLAGLGLKQLTLEAVLHELGTANAQLWDVIYAGMQMAQAVIVLMTGDDEARLCEGLADAPQDLTRQARQNVLIEAGLALGMCDNRTIVVRCTSAVIPADFSGLFRIDVPGDGDWRVAVQERLAIAGCPLEADETTWPDKDALCRDPGDR